MAFVKRERWTEEDIDALPPGEHDYFERKSGQLFAKQDELLGKLAKTLSALANSGGGHIVLGVDDGGVPDGVPTTQGRTPMRDWLEQKLPRLVEYPLADFRVHVVEPAASSRIPGGLQVIVVDVGDSALAPHQCAVGAGDARKYTYYHRQAGRSEPAPHFYLELLRQRLVNPVLEAEPIQVGRESFARVDGALFVGLLMRFRVANTGRVAAYKWQIQLRGLDGHPEGRFQDYRFRPEEYPNGRGGGGGIRLDDTILPGGVLEEEIRFGVYLRPEVHAAQTIIAEIERMILGLTLRFRVATETSPGETTGVQLREVPGAEALTQTILGHC